MLQFSLLQSTLRASRAVSSGLDPGLQENLPSTTTDSLAAGTCFKDALAVWQHLPQVNSVAMAEQHRGSPLGTRYVGRDDALAASRVKLEHSAATDRAPVQAIHLSASIPRSRFRQPATATNRQAVSAAKVDARNCREKGLDVQLLGPVLMVLERVC